MLAGNAIQDKEITIPAGIEQQLARLPLEFPIDDDRSLGRIPIVRIMRRGLEIPRQFPRIHIHSDDGGGIEVVSFAGHTGTNTLSFQGRISASKMLPPARYTLLITATNTVGQNSQPQSLDFTIVK